MRLTADIKPFVAAMAKAEAAAKKLRDGLGDSYEPFEKETQKQKQRAPRQAEEVAGAFARSFSRSLESAFRALPKANITADSTDAQIKLATLRQAMQELSGKTIGVDINAAAALGELRAVQMELERLGTSAEIDIRADATAALSQLQSVQREVDRLGGETARVEVDADTAGAESKLAAVGSEVSRLNGRNARVRVDADVSGALAGIAMVGAALASLPAAASIGLGVGALGGAFAAAGAGAGAFAAVAVPSFGRVSDALKASESAAKAAGGATGGAGKSAAQAASEVLQLEEAEKRLRDAQTDAKRAQEDLTAAREAGRRALEDMNFSLDRSVLSQKDAALAVREAYERMAEVNADPGASDLERERAALSYEQAQQRVEEQEVKTARAIKDTAQANKLGVKGTDEYRQGLDDLKTAQDKVAQAEQQLKLLHLQQQQAMSGGGGAAGGLKDAFADLSKQEKELVKDLKAFNTEYLDWQRSLQPDVLPVISKGLNLLAVGMNKATPLVRASAGAFGELIDATSEGLKSEEWNSFFYDLTTTAPRAIEGLGTSAGNVATGLAGVLQAFLPYTDDLMTFLEDATQGFEDWGQNLKGSPEFESFINYVKENGPKVGEVLGNLATFVGKILGPAAGAGEGALDFLVTLSEKLAGMDPAQVEAIAKGVLAIFAAAKLGASLQIGAFVLLAEVLAKMSPGQIQAVALAIAATVAAVKGYQAVTGAVGFWNSIGGSIGKAGNAADGAKGKFGGLAGALKTGGIAVALTAVAVGADAISDSLAGLNPDINALARGLNDVSTSGKIPPELLDLLGQKSAMFGSNALETFAQSAARLASDDPFNKIGNSVTGFIDSFDIITLDNGKQAIGELDKTLVTMVSQGNAGKAAQLFQDLAKMAGEAGVPVDKLKQLMPGYTEVVAAAGDASATAAGGVDEVKKSLDGFQTSVDTFNATTDTAKAIRDLDLAYQSAKKAIDNSSVGLDINRAKTDEQRDAAILARDAFSGYISKIDEIGKAQQIAGKNTGESTIKVAEQLPKLFDLAGKSKEASDRVYDLAEKYGISRTQADKAREGTEKFKDELALIKSKSVKLDVDTKTAQAQLDNIVRTLADIVRRASLASVGGLNASSARGNAWGGIQNRNGAPDYMAQGGIRSLGANPSAMIAKSPYTISGRGGPDVVFGEAGWEAFIPLDSSKRGRGLDVLGEAASAMGMAVVPQQMAASGASSSAGSGGSSFSGGPAMVTVTGIDALRSSLDVTSMDLTTSLGGATSTLDATLGDTGTLTTSVDGVGAAAGVLAGEVTGWGEVISVQFPPLVTAVADLSTAVSAAATAANEAKSSTGSKADEGNPRDGSAPGYVAGSAPKSKAASSSNNASATMKMVPLKDPAGYIEGYANGGITNRPSIFGEAGLEAAVPLGPGKRSQGLQVLGQAAQHLGVTVNRSRVSRPTMSSYSGGSTGSAVPEAPGGTSGTSGAAPSRGNAPLVSIGTLHAERMTADELAERLYFKATSRG
ncbi:MAG: hypothetical protein ABR585_07810 [Gemmatimonadaceae bacterium]